MILIVYNVILIINKIVNNVKILILSINMENVNFYVQLKIKIVFNVILIINQFVYNVYKIIN